MKTKEAIKTGNYTLAAHHLESILQNDPKHDVAWVMAANLFSDPQKKYEYATKAMQANPNNRDAKLILDVSKKEVHKEEANTLYTSYGLLLIVFFL